MQALLMTFSFGGLIGLITFLLFLVATITAGTLLLSALIRGVAGVIRSAFQSPQTGTIFGQNVVASPQSCPHARCGHVNPSRARFCARCGRALRRAFEDAA